MNLSQSIIKAEHISMRFRMANDKVQSLKEYVISSLKGKLKFNDFWVFKDLNFEIKKGEVVGIIGKNGAGKSTLLKIIAGVLSPTEGKLSLDGNVVPMLELGSGFDFELSGRENIYLNGAILGYSKRLIDEKYEEIVSFSELGKFIDEPIRNYSSGMLMRLAFSVATIVNPEILIVDEILAVGDEGFQKKSKRKMLELMGGGTTVLFVSHSLSQIREMCRRVIWLDDGEIRMDGSSKEVCDEYENFINPSQNSAVALKINNRNTDAYKFCMDVLLIYGDRKNSYSRALIIKEELLAGNMCSHELYEKDLNNDVIKQYRCFIFVEVDYDQNSKLIAKIVSLNKRILLDSNDEEIISKWYKTGFINAGLCSTGLGCETWNKFGVECFKVGTVINEDMQKYISWAEYDINILPYKNINDCKSEQEIINYNKAVSEAKERKIEGFRIAFFLKQMNENTAGEICEGVKNIHEYIHNSYIYIIIPKEECKDFNLEKSIKLQTYASSEEMIRLLSAVDVVIGVNLNTYDRELISLLTGLLKVAYTSCSTLNWNEVKKFINETQSGKISKEIDQKFTNALENTTIQKGFKLAEYLNRHINHQTVFLLQDTTEIKKTNIVKELAKKSFDEGQDIVIFVDSPKANDLKVEDVCLPVISKSVKEIYGNLDIVYAMGPNQFNYMLMYPNINQRKYYIEKWEPGFINAGDFERFRANQTYCPYIDVQYFTDSKNCVQWMKEKYDRRIELIYFGG